MNSTILVNLAAAVRLREGSEGVRTFLREVYQNQGISTKACSRNIRLPLPITAALKKEAIKAGLLVEGPTMRLTPVGMTFCQEQLGFNVQFSFVCPRCGGLKYLIPEEYQEVLSNLQMYLNHRPSVDVTLDQAHGTPETALRRAILALEQGAMFGKRIALLGDDDLVSVALILLWQATHPAKDLPPITVFDIDLRLLDYIDSVATECNAAIETVHYDMRDPWPADHTGVYQGVFTDPPYTLSGANLFLTRAKQALQQELGLPVFFSFGQKSPAEMMAIQMEVLKLGFVIEEIIPDFNHYEGAAILGNIGQMLVLKTADRKTPKLGCFAEAIYTQDVQ